VPCVTPAEIETLATHALERPPAAVFAASRSGRGTNGVALAPPAVMPLTFGEPSFANHLATARAHGLVPSVLALHAASAAIAARKPDCTRNVRRPMPCSMCATATT